MNKQMEVVKWKSKIQDIELSIENVEDELHNLEEELEDAKLYLAALED